MTHRYEVIDPLTSELLAYDAFLDKLLDAMKAREPLEVEVRQVPDELSARRKDQQTETMSFRPVHFDLTPFWLRAQRVDANDWFIFTYHPTKECVTLHAE